MQFSKVLIAIKSRNAIVYLRILRGRCINEACITCVTAGIKEDCRDAVAA